MLTLLIPTINRSDFIIKYLTYLRDNQFKGQVLIGDSSNEDNFKTTADFISQSNFSFRVKQYEFPGLYPHPCIQRMLDDIDEPYSMFICDDDILILNTLYKCIQFLENNHSYSSVGGVSILATLNPDDYCEILSVIKYNINEVKENTSLERTQNLLKNYSVIGYSLSRTSEFKKRWPKASKNHDKGIGTELLPSAIIAAQGKVKMLDSLFVVRQIHERRIILPNFMETILQPHWTSSTNFAIEYVAKIVSEVDKISKEEAFPLVKEAWVNGYEKRHLHKYLMKKKSDSFNFKSWLKQIKHISKIARIIIEFIRKNRVIITASQGEISLPALLNTSSTYHKDFLPVYKAITQSRQGRC